MRGKFILSLDCEGKWGVADHLGPEHHAGLSDESIRLAYKSVRSILTEYEVPATFAVTEAFLLSPSEQRRLPWSDITQVLPYAAKAASERNDAKEGWSAPWLPGLLNAVDELGCHGFTHAPWGELTRDQARFEIGMCSTGDGRTFVYPRNQVHHTDLIANSKFLGYREAPPVRSRLRSLASEFNLLTRSQLPAASEPAVAIPGGYFVNWLNGPRRLVPPAVTRLRARRIVSNACTTGGVAHFWTHPENIAMSPATLMNFEAVLKEAARARDRGELDILTQAEYARSVMT